MVSLVSLVSLVLVLVYGLYVASFSSLHSSTQAVAILPQLFMLQKQGGSENLTSHYIFLLGMYSPPLPPHLLCLEP